MSGIHIMDICFVFSLSVLKVIRGFFVASPSPQALLGTNSSLQGFVLACEPAVNRDGVTA